MDLFSGRGHHDLHAEWAICDWMDWLVKLGNSSADAVTTSGEFD